MRFFEFGPFGLQRVLPPVFRVGPWGRAVVDPPARPAFGVRFPNVFGPQPVFVGRGL